VTEPANLYGIHDLIGCSVFKIVPPRLKRPFELPKEDIDIG
jgi:hypothetical protein